MQDLRSHKSLRHSSSELLNNTSFPCHMVLKPAIVASTTMPLRAVGFRQYSKTSQDTITMSLEISSNPESEDLWNHALDSYLVAMSPSLEDKAALKRIHNADDLFAQLDAGHDKRENWRNKHSKFFSALSKAMRPFVLVSEIAQYE
jgi:hypothetical protein